MAYAAWPKQLEYHQSEKPNLLFWGGRGSGKSHCGRWDAHMKALAHPGFTYCILRRTYPELQKSHLIHMSAEMKMLGGTWNATDKIALYPNGSRGFFAHCADDTDVLKLLSSEYALMFFDELSTFQWEQFTKLAASCRVTEDSGLVAQLRAATNPLGPSAAEVMKYFVNKDVDPMEDEDYNPDDWDSIHANVEDNPSLDKTQYQKRFAGLPAHVRKAWVDGEFILENALFDLKPTVKQELEDGHVERRPWHVVDDLDLDKIVKKCEIYRTIDAGWFPDPTVCLWVAHLGNRHIILWEETWYRKTAAEVARAIKEIDKELGIERVAITYCDPAMDINTSADIRTLKEIYEANGISMETSVNKRDQFATAMHHALNTTVSINGNDEPYLQIYSKGCPILIKTIPMMSYDAKHPEKMADHKHDHWVVAACYYLMSHGSDLKTSSLSTPKLRKWMLPKKSDRPKPLGHSGVRT